MQRCCSETAAPIKKKKKRKKERKLRRILPFCPILKKLVAIGKLGSCSSVSCFIVLYHIVSLTSHGITSCLNRYGIIGFCIVCMK